MIGFVEACFTRVDMNLAKTLKCYLTRSAYAIDRDDSSVELEIKKTFLDRSTPQGSLVSPALWRIFDKIFSYLYINSLTVLH